MRAFVSSWRFPPYNGSAELDLFKRLKHVDATFEIVQAKQATPTEGGLFDDSYAARFNRYEVEVDGAPRTRVARDRFVEGVQTAFRNGPPCDVVLSHSNEVVSHDAALTLKSQARLPWVAYFGDVVAANPYVRYLGEYPLFEEDVVVEARTLSRADLVICNNDEQRRLFIAIAGAGRAHRVVVIPHAYDESQYRRTRAPRVPSVPLQLLHVGGLYSEKRTARPLLAATELLLDIYPRLAGRFCVEFVGAAASKRDLEHWRAMRWRDHVKFTPSVTWKESIAAMERADVLIVIDGIFGSEDGLTASPYFPGKLADYAGAGRPLVAVTMARGPTADLVAELGGISRDDRPEHVAYAMKQAIEGRLEFPTPPLRLRAEIVGAQMELALRAAIAGEAAIARLQESLAAIPSRVIGRTR